MEPNTIPASLSNHEILSRDDESALVARAQAGDKRAADKLIVSNQRLVLKFARKFRQTGLPLADLVQEGSIGLVQALAKFDASRGLRFTTYAGHWVNAAILAYVRKNSRQVKVCTTALHRKLFWAIRRARAQGSVDAAAIAESLGCEIEDVLDFEQRLQGENSLQAPAGSEEGAQTAQDMLADDGDSPEEAARKAQFDAQLRSGLVSFGASLEGRELEIFRDRIVCSERVELLTIAKRWGLSKERVRQIEQRLVRKLREFLAGAMN